MDLKRIIDIKTEILSEIMKYYLPNWKGKLKTEIKLKHVLNSPNDHVNCFYLYISLMKIQRSESNTLKRKR